MSEGNGIRPAALAVAKKLNTELVQATIREHAAIESAVRDGRMLAEHYWQERHSLQRRLEAVEAIIDVLESEGVA
jgi:hypothetical protein